MPFLYIPGRKFRQVPHNKLAVCCDEAKGRNRLARMPVVFITAGIRTGPREFVHWEKLFFAWKNEYVHGHEYEFKKSRRVRGITGGRGIGVLIAPYNECAAQGTDNRKDVTTRFW